jgi:hypothetical protein
MHASIHISVKEDDCIFIHSTGVLPDGGLIAPMYEHLNPDRMFCSDSYVTARPSSPDAYKSSLASPAFGTAVLRGEAHREAAHLTLNG